VEADPSRDLGRSHDRGPASPPGDNDSSRAARWPVLGLTLLAVGILKVSLDVLDWAVFGGFLRPAKFVPSAVLIAVGVWVLVRDRAGRAAGDTPDRGTRVGIRQP